MDPSAPTRGYESLIADVQSGAVLEVEVGGDDLIVHLRDGVAYTVSGFAEDQGILAWLDDSGIAVYEDRSSAPWLLPAVLGLAVLVGVVYALRRRQQAGTAAGKTIFDMRRSNARQLKPGLEQTRFADVGGHEEIKEALGDVVDFLKEPARWTNAGVRLPRGVLLEGPPGGGKTLLARAVAGEAGAPFFVISASEFVEMFVGVGAARIRDLFETARKVSPAVIFIDEIDAVGRRRGSGLGTAHDEREQTLNQLLVCLDGFEPSTRLVVIAATNRSDVLDRALLRPGRFDLRLTLGFPDVNARAQILKIHCRGKPLTPGLDLRLVAEATPGASGATLEHLCNEAGMRAVRRSRKADRSAAPAPATITVDDFLGALESASKIERKFDALDALLVESTSQFTQPSGEVHARLALADGSTIDGRIVWADASYVKIVPSAPAGVVARLIPKSQLRGVEALAGTSMADEIRPDAWAKSRTESA
ncbi:MAG: AAA family ATPase [Myxococcales bacterium]|nr:AAA family ATPase [Myxococcales bacterium]